MVNVLNTKESQDVKKNYRTVTTAGNVSIMPDKLATITNRKYKNAIDFCNEGGAYMMPLDAVDGLEISDGKFIINGMPASRTDLYGLVAAGIPDNINLAIPKALLTIILENNAKNIEENKPIAPVTTIYIPEFFQYVGKKTVSRNEVLSLINGILSFQSMMGTIDGDILPVLVFMGECQVKNTLSFSSPYLNRVIEKINASSICTDKNGNPIIQSNGKPKTKPSYSYIVKPSIYSERNQKAVAIVFIVIAVIEQAGNNEPHISAKTILNRNIMLRESFYKMKSPSDKNKCLARAFSKAWELLQTQTDLEKVYLGIELPDSTDKRNIPTISKLDTVFTFKHHGKQKGKSDENN